MLMQQYHMSQYIILHCVALPQKGHSPKCSAHVYCGQTARWIKMPLGTEVGLGPGDIGGQQPPSLAHVCCGQTVAFLTYC